jgi:O-antigen/teichoic acid export membrane protein
MSELTQAGSADERPRSSLDGPADQPQDASSDIRRKALASVAQVAGRDTIVKLVAVLGNVAFARLLSPKSFGTVAFGLAVLYFGQLLSDGGLGVGLIRRPEAPHLDDLRVLLGYQLVLTIVIAVVVATVAAPFGRVGLITAVMMPALPLLAFRVPSSIVFERDLNYGPLVRVEIAEQLSYYVWGITSVALGAGVWGLATASVVKALIGTIAMLRVSPVAKLTPAYAWQRLKPMLGFGVKFQAVQLVNAGGLQLLNFGVAGIGGIAVLGLWTMAWRLLQIPALLFGALWRVSYPAMAKLLAAGESERHLIERAVGLAAVGTGLIIVPATGALSPLIPAVLGHRWAPVADVLPVAFFALQASGPVSVATAGYLYAVGETTAILRAATVTSVVWPVVTFPLLPSLGVVSLGLGCMVSALVEIPLLARPAHRRSGARVLRPVLMPWLAASIGGGSGLVISRTVSHGIVAAVLGASVATCVYAIPLFLFRRDAVRTILRVVSNIVKRNAGAAPQG